MQQLSGGIPFVHSSLAGEIPFLKLMIGQKNVLYSPQFCRSKFVEISLWNYIHYDFRGQSSIPMK